MFFFSSFVFFLDRYVLLTRVDTKHKKKWNGLMVNGFKGYSHHVHYDFVLQENAHVARTVCQTAPQENIMTVEHA